MKQAVATLSTSYLAVGGVLAAVALAVPSLGELAVAAAALLLVPAMLTARRRGHLPDPLGPWVTASGALVAAAHVVAGGVPGVDRPLSLVLGLAGCIGLVVASVVFVRDHTAAPPSVLLGDAAIVTVGGWIVCWTTLAQPMSQQADAFETVLFALYHTATWVVAFLVVMLLAGGRNRPAAVWLLAAAAACHAVATLLTAAADAGRVSWSVERWSLALLALAPAFVAAAFAHPSLGELTRRVPANPTAGRGRLVVVCASLVLAVLALAATSAADTSDRITRAASAAVLAGMVIARAGLAARVDRRAREALLHGAHTDPLTGLPNRAALLDRINDLLSTSWERDVHPTLFFVDLDRFKNINDSLGHAAGDEVLVAVAARLREIVPAGATVARLSGDEYVVLDPTSSSDADAAALADRLLGVCREPLPLSHGDAVVTASIGVATISPTTATSPEDLVRRADTAMYKAKDRGRNCYARYTEDMHETVAHRLAMETALYRALDRRELRLFHQPIVDVDTYEVVGFEALMRWQRSDGTMVSPGEFIPIAEETGTIVHLGSWAILEALSQLRRWIDDGVCSARATMSVNVSPRQLSDRHFASIVGEALTRSGMSPEQLWLEVTESVMISDPETAETALIELRDMGVRVALDDFGTGYSSLSLLQKFPIQRLKIDRAFVHGVADNANDEALVRTIVVMGNSLHLDLVAEGVETFSQLEALRKVGCTKAQGFLFSYPVPADGMRLTVEGLERLRELDGLRPPSVTSSTSP